MHAPFPFHFCQYSLGPPLRKPVLRKALSEISLEEFIAFFEIHSHNVHKAGEMVDAIFEEEDTWYVARVVQAIQKNDRHNHEAASYVLRFRGYEDDGKFEVPADKVRARFKPGDACVVVLDDNHLAVCGGTPAFVVSQTDEGYVVRIPSEGNRVATCYASDIFNE